MKKLLRFAAATLAFGSSLPASAIVAASGFEEANPWVNQGDYNDGSPIGAPLSGLGSRVPYGSFDASTVGFVAWEKFASGSFLGLAPQYFGNSGILQASLSQAGSGIGLSTDSSNPGKWTVDGTDYYGRLTCGLESSYAFSLTATSTQPIASVTLAIKHSNFYDIEDVEDPATWTQVAPFSATLDGVGSEPAEWLPEESEAAFGNFSDALSMGTYSRYYLYTWEVGLDAGEEFTIDFSSLAEEIGLGFSVDAVALSVETVPEPGTLALAAIGGLGLWWRLRARRSR